ncbi:MAG TPA: hypothetical protein VGD84_12325 [Pseudonocardiaceae bacterium]
MVTGTAHDITGGALLRVHGTLNTNGDVIADMIAIITTAATIT